MRAAEGEMDHRNDPRGTAPPLTLAPAPSLPKGGGAIRGMGEKFAARAFTGTASLSVPLPVTPARSGFHPELALSYDSGAGNGPFGLGWHLALPSITRKTDKQLPRYGDADDSDVFLLSGVEDLVPSLEEPRVHDGVRIRRYRPRIESAFSRIERHEAIATGDLYWVAVSAGNVRNIYGRTARIADPRDGRRVFSWLLERSEDALGNVIAYHYVKEDLGNVPESAAEAHRRNDTVAGSYLSHVDYGNRVPGDESSWAFRVVFDYGDHPPFGPERAQPPNWPARLDPFSSYRAGFEVRTYRLCQQVMLFHRFDDLGVTPCLVHATRFAYGYDERATMARLSSVVQEGYIRQGDHYSKPQATPPLRFAYGEVQLHTEIGVIDVADIEGGIDGKRHHWVDLDGEGLPGALSDDGGALYYRRNLGGGALDTS